VFKPSTVEEFLHIAWSELAQVALRSSSEPVALGFPILVCPSALGLVTPAGRYSLSHHVPNTIDGRRSRRLRALLAQTFLRLSQLPFALSRDRQLRELIYDPFFHVGKNAFTVGTHLFSLVIRTNSELSITPTPRTDKPCP
jgi:hypothetical protein